MKYGLFKTNILIYHFTTLPGELTCHPAGTFEDDDLPFSHLVGYGLVSWRVIWNLLFHEGWCLENKLLLFSNNLEPLKPPIQSCLKNMYFPMSSRIFFVNHRIRYPLTSTRLSPLSSPAATHPPFFSSHTFSHTTVDTLNGRFGCCFPGWNLQNEGEKLETGNMSENWEHDCWESAGANDAKASETQETLLRNIPKVLVLQNSSPHCDTHSLNRTKDGCMCIFSFQYSQTHLLKANQKL